MWNTIQQTPGAVWNGLVQIPGMINSCGQWLGNQIADGIAQNRDEIAQLVVDLL